uniref:Uncharacterized protein n=1 Tax=Romanomermis culicivorax TaxID=13658 RepID=A0A915J3R0_ROMCU
MDDDDLDLDNDSPATESSALTTFLKPSTD